MEPKKDEQNQNTEQLEIKVKELEEKQANLNQGIASYRDDAQIANKRVGELETKISELEIRLSETGKKNIELDKNDEELLESYSEKKGFVTKDELEKFRADQIGITLQGLHNQAVNEFLGKYPQYNSDENWKKVQQEFGLYKTPNTLQGFQQLLSKIHNSLSVPDLEKRGADKARAEIANKGRLSLGGGSQMSNSKDLTVEDLQKQYPNLNKEQIQSRLNEIESLYPEKK